MSTTPSSRRGFLRQTGRVALAGALPMAGLLEARAQSPAPAWKPQSTVRLVVATAAGGATDIFARVIAEPLATRLGRPVIVENKPGASGMIGSGHAYRATDGHTFFIATLDNITLAPLVQPKMDHNPMEMVPVISLGTIDMALSTRGDLPPDNLADFIAYAKNNKLNYAHWGAGALGHLVVESFKAKTGIRDLQGIPYNGSAPGIQALISGQVDVMPVPLNQAITYRKQLKVLANFGTKRFDRLADVPTMREQGVDFALSSWLGVFAPPKTSKDVVDSLHAALLDITGTPAYLQKLTDSGMNAHRFDSPAAYAGYIRDNFADMQAAVAASGYKPQA